MLVSTTDIFGVDNTGNILMVSGTAMGASQ